MEIEKSMSIQVAHRVFQSLPEVELQLIHGKCRPLEIFPGDQVYAVVEKVVGQEKDQVYHRLQVYRISAMGIELHIDSFQNALLPFECDLKPGVNVNLTLHFRGQKTPFHGLTILTRHQEGAHYLIGMKFQQDTEENLENATERRSKKRWDCEPDFFPTGVATHPLLLNDSIYFKVLDFSRHGMQLMMSLRNQVIFNGILLDAEVHFPVVGTLKIPMKVENCRIASMNGKDYLNVGVTVHSLSPAVSEILGQYALRFISDNNVKSLRDEGLVVKNASNSFDVSYVKTPEDYREVLKFRLQAYSAAGKMDPSSPIEAAGDVFDQLSRIVMFKHQGKLVGSVRVRFHGAGDQLEHEQFITLPVDFPDKNDVLEVSRICTDPNYRGSNLVYAIMRYASLIVAQSKRRWLFGSATESLVPLYKKMGFKALEVSFPYPTLNNQKHILLLGDVPRMLCGWNVKPAMWKLIYSDLYGYLRSHHGLQVNMMDVAHVAAYRVLTTFHNSSQ